MAWDKTKPSDADPISQGDDVIRELKQDLENAFKTEFGSDWDGSLEKSIHNFLTIPEINSEGQIKLRSYNNGMTLDIFYNGSWLRATQLFDFPIDAILVSKSTESWFGWQIVSLDKNYLLVLGNNLGVYPNGYEPHADIYHTHQVYEQYIQHTHTMSATMEHTTNEVKSWRGWEAGNIWKKEHTHPITINVSNPMIAHNHTLSSEHHKFNVEYCKLIRKIN